MTKSSETYCPLGRFIDAERRHCGIAVSDFCRQARISKKTYYKILSGKTY
ncbi:MAG: hypothetical protein IJ494_03440 [Bacteroides sp.]|nr:hypothetical protein [Bacteroides sp.]